MKNSSNIIFIYGCPPGEGVKATSLLVADTIKLYSDNFNTDKGEIILPDIYSKVVSSDAKFEVVTCVEASKLSLER